MAYQQYFYDEQIRRFLLQFARIFSQFQVEYGKTEAGEETLLRVPVRYGDSSRNAQTIIQNNSANFMPSCPLITFHISGLDYDRPRMQEPYFVEKQNVRQRTYDSDIDEYEVTQGNAFTIEKLMPVPYRLTLSTDIWTSNTNQKFQIFEQIATLFNPALEIQSTDNFIDWTSLTVVELQDVNWSSRTIPTGDNDSIDIMTMRFQLPIWISSPTKVKKLGVVEKIIASVYDSGIDARDAIGDNDLLLGTRQKFTPFGYQTILIGNKLQALKSQTPNNNPVNDNTKPPETLDVIQDWRAIVELYGTLRPGISQIRLTNNWDDSEIVGTISYDPTDQRFLLFSVDSDTIPQNTLEAVNSVIDPFITAPDIGLPAATVGQRYLILQSIGDSSSTGPTSTTAWGNLVASANSIIEYNGTSWTISFNSDHQNTNIQYVSNVTTSLQYRWTTTEWVKSYEGFYGGGDWSLVL
jgi:hypothetical protein